MLCIAGGFLAMCGPMCVEHSTWDRCVAELLGFASVAQKVEKHQPCPMNLSFLLSTKPQLSVYLSGSLHREGERPVSWQFSS